MIKPISFVGAWLARFLLIALLSVFVQPVNGQQGFKGPDEIDGSRLAGSKQEGNSRIPKATGTQDNRTKALIRELDNLIPGDFEEGAEGKKAIVAIVAEFQKGNADAVVKLVETEAKKPDYPAADVLLAALSFSSNDQKTGLLLLERGAANHPDDPSVYSAFARLAINSGRTTDAKVLFEKLKSLTDKAKFSEEAAKFYQAQYFDGMIDIEITQKHYGQARILLEKQRAILPDHPKVLMVSAELEFKENKIEKCLNYLAAMKKKYPQSRAPEAIVASWYQRTGKIEESEKWIRKAAEIYPTEPQVQLEFASWALNNEDFSTASAAVKKAEAKLQESTYSQNLKAKIAFAQEAFSVAESHYETLIAKQPMDSDLSNMYALTLVEAKDRGKYDRALGIASRNIRALPNNRIALASLGYIQMRGGDMNGAQQSFNEAAKLSGNSPEIDFFFASYLNKLGNVAAAKKFLDRALGQKGLFLYRAAARRLKKELDAKALPIPKSEPTEKPADKK